MLMGRHLRNEGSVEATAPPVKWRGSNPLYPPTARCRFLHYFWVRVYVLSADPRDGHRQFLVRQQWQNTL